jgi:hypothetical protein
MNRIIRFRRESVSVGSRSNYKYLRSQIILSETKISHNFTDIVSLLHRTEQPPPLPLIKSLPHTIYTMLLNFNAFVALFALISLGITHASVVGADNGTQIVRCGNPDPSLEYLQQTQELFSVMEKQGRLITLNATGQANPPPISVDVYAWLLVEDTEDKAYWPPVR